MWNIKVNFQMDKTINIKYETDYFFVCYEVLVVSLTKYKSYQ